MREHEARDLRGRRNARACSSAGPADLQAFVRTKEKHPVLEDGPPGSGAKLVAAENTVFTGLIETVTRIQSIILEELVGRAMELIRAAFSDDLNLSTRIAPEFCVEIVRYQFEFLDGIQAQCAESCTSRRGDIRRDYIVDGDVISPFFHRSNSKAGHPWYL